MWLVGLQYAYHLLFATASVHERRSTLANFRIPEGQYRMGMHVSGAWGDRDWGLNKYPHQRSHWLIPAACSNTFRTTVGRAVSPAKGGSTRPGLVISSPKCYKRIQWVLFTLIAQMIK